VKLVLVNANVILSQEEVVYYLGALDFIVYPNPAAVANGFKVLRKDLEDATLILYDLLGRKVRQLLLQDLVNPVKTSSLQRGMYFIMILDKNGKQLYTQKVVLD
jgi:hypothetical protein